MLPGFPQKIMRIERNTMATDAGARIKRHEPEWFGRGRANYFPGVDVQRIAKPRHLVRHADINGAKCVLEKFGCFRHARGTDGMNVVHNLRIQKCRCRS